jgi:hypothetical protein
MTRLEVWGRVEQRVGGEGGEGGRARGEEGNGSPSPYLGVLKTK